MKLVRIKLFKIILITFIALFLLSVAGIFAFIQFYPEEKVLELVIEKAEKTLQRKITVSKLEYSLRGLSLQKIALYDGKTTKAPLLFSAEEASLGFSLVDLFDRKLSINYLYFNNLKITISYDDSGVSNLHSILKNLTSKNNKSDPLLETSIDKIRLNNMTVTLENPQGNLAPLEGTYTLSALLLMNLKKDKNIRVTNCSVTLPEDRGRGNPDINISIAPGEVTITGNVGLENTSVLWTYAWTKNPKAQPYHRVTGDVSDLKLSIFPPSSPKGVPERTTVKIEGRVKATSSLTTSNKLVHAEGFASIDSQKRSIYISGVNGKIDTSSASLERLHFSFAGKIFDIYASHFSFQVGDLRSLLRFIPEKLYGRLEGNLSYRAKTINSSVKLINMGYDAEEKYFSNLTTELKIADNLFKKEQIPVKIMGNKALVSIASVDPSLQKIFVNVNTPDFIFPKKTGKSENKSGTGKRAPAFTFNFPIAITGRIDAGSLSYDVLKLDGLAVNYIISGNKINIKQWKAGILGGNIMGQGSIISSGGKSEATLSFNFRDIKIQQLGNLHEKMENRFFGIGIGNGHLSYVIGSGGLLTGMKGMVEFQIARGKIVDTGIQNGLGIWLSELKYKLKDLEFNTIYGNITLNMNNYLINSFVFNSDDIRLKLKGIINSDLIASDMDISLDFTRNFIQDLPTPAIRLGLDKYQRGRWYIIPFTANGNITEGKNIRRVK